MPRNALANPVALQALGALLERPMHPYQLATTLSTRGVPVNRGSLYADQTRWPDRTAHPRRRHPTRPTIHRYIRSTENYRGGYGLRGVFWQAYSGGRRNALVVCEEFSELL